MASENPFSEQYPIRTINHSNQIPAQGGSQVLKALGVIALIGVFACSGLGLLAYWGVQRVVGPKSDLELPPRLNAFDSDQKKFNQSLATLSDDSQFDPEVCKLVDRTVAAINAGKDLPFSREIFVEAVAASPISGGSLGFVDRLTLQNSLLAYEPTPTSEVEYYRILNVRIESQGTLGVVDLIVYSEDRQVESYQWFVVKQEGRWKFYDWQCLEHGRRKSDEYAAFVRGPERLSPGFDNMLIKLGDASTQWEAGNEPAAKRILKACEDTPMLAEDRDEGYLHIASTWMSFGEYDEAIRVAKRIQFPDRMWGVWPVLGACHVFLGNYDEALVAAQHAQQQSPDHPNVLTLLSATYSNTDRIEEAANAAARALTICREDRNLLQNVLDFDRVEDIPLLLDLVTGSQSDEGWPSLLNQADRSPEWAAALVEEMERRQGLPAGVAELARGSLAWAQEDYDAAARFYFAAKDKVQGETQRKRATNDHLAARLEEDRFDELFGESNDVATILATLVERAYDDNLYCDESKLLEALQKQDAGKTGPWAAGLRGWASYNLANYEDALHAYEEFLAWLNDNSQTLGDDRKWIVETTEYYMAETLLELNRPLDVVTRWPEDIDRHEQAGSHLLRRYDESSIAEFLEQTSETKNSSLRVQRFRLAAAVAMRAGDARQCDLRHRDAIELGRVVYDEDNSYLVDSLIRERAKHLVWNRVEDDVIEAVGAEEGARARRQDLVLYATSDAASILDVDLVERWIRRASVDGVRDAATDAQLQQTLGNLRLLTGDIQGAVDALRNSFAATDEESSWFYHRRRGELFDALLAVHAWEAARELVGDEVEPDSNVPLAAIIDLASGNEAALQSTLAGHDKTAVAAWLTDVSEKPHVERFCDQPWVIELLKQSPVAVGYRDPHDHGALLLVHATPIDQQVVRRVLDQALNESFTLEIVPASEQDGEMHIWLAVSTSGQRLLLSRSVSSYETRGLAPSLAAALSQPMVRLTIEILDHQPNATRRLFTVAAGFAELNAALFSWGDESLTWTGPELARKLKWQERVPVGRHVFPVSLQRKEGERRESDEFIELEVWARRLEESGGPIPTSVNLTSQWCTEAVPAELLVAHPDNYELNVRPLVDSKTNPIVKAAISYSAGPWSVSPILAEE